MVLKKVFPFLIAGFLAQVFYCKADGPEKDIYEFVEKHWNRPLPLMGDKPANLSPVTLSADPQSCKPCHPDQFDAWKDSLHSHAMSPGLLGQLVEYDTKKTGPMQSCLNCHAPLAEQTGELIKVINEQLDTPAMRAKLDSIKGLGCQGCHVRNWQWFGPVSNRENGQNVKHNGFMENRAFSDSYFCAACHQFKENQRSLNGKLIENTYNEWKDSGWAKEGVQCQNCHMPGRQHLWKGIHDIEMTKSALEIELLSFESDGEFIKADLKITNAGAGHYFPTYLVPQIFVYGSQYDEGNNEIRDARNIYTIGRNVNLSLTEEIFDNRIPPQKSVTIHYVLKKSAHAKYFAVRIIVEPDYFYARFYKSWLEKPHGELSKKLIQQALDQTEKNKYLLYFIKKEIIH